MRSGWPSISASYGYSLGNAVVIAFHEVEFGAFGQRGRVDYLLRSAEGIARAGAEERRYMDIGEVGDAGLLRLLRLIKSTGFTEHTELVELIPDS
jgi:hypothetical protein